MLKMIRGLKKYIKSLKWFILGYFILLPFLSYYEVFVSTKVGSIINSWTGQVPNFNILFHSGIFIGFLYLIQGIWNFIVWELAEFLFKRSAEQMKNDIFTHILKLPVSYFDQETTGTIMEKAFGGIKSITPVLFSIPVKILSSIIALLATGFAMMKINVQFAII